MHADPTPRPPANARPGAAHLGAQIDAQLALRADELAARLRAGLDDADAQAAGGVADLKDLADHDTQSAVDDARGNNAAQELVDVVAARRRLRLGSYGRCVECGAPLPLGRLLALPAAALCVNCQDAHDTGRRIVRA